MADILNFPMLPGAPGTKTILVCMCGGQTFEIRDTCDIICAACGTVSDVVRAFDPSEPPPPAA